MNERSDSDTADRDDDGTPAPPADVEGGAPAPEPPAEEEGRDAPAEPREDVPGSTFRQVWGTDPPRGRRFARDLDSRTRPPGPPAVPDTPEAAPAEATLSHALGASLESVASRTERSERKLEELAREVRDLAAAVRRLAGGDDPGERPELRPGPARAGGLAAEVERLLRGGSHHGEEHPND